LWVIYLGYGGGGEGGFDGMVVWVWVGVVGWGGEFGNIRPISWLLLILLLPILLDMGIFLGSDPILLSIFVICDEEEEGVAGTPAAALKLGIL
jgi:hypothetical protein